MVSTSTVDLETLLKVFQSFDKNQDGFLDHSEISLAAKELGTVASEQEIKNLFAEIDVNHDGRISFEEFSAWLSFNQGVQNKKLSLYKLKAVSLVKKAKSSLSKLPPTYESGFHTHEVAVKFGESEPGTKFEVKLHYGLASIEHFDHLSKGLTFEENATAIVVKLHSDNAENAKFGLKDLIESSLELASALIPGVEQVASLLKFSYHSEGEFVLVGITGKHPIVQEAIQTASQVISSFVNDEFTATAGFALLLKNDLKTLFEKSKYDEAPLLGLILEGFLLDIYLRYNSQVAKQLIQLLFSRYSDLYSVPVELRRTVLLALLTNSKLNLNFNAGDQENLDKVLGGLGLGELSSFNLFAIIKQVRDLGVVAMLDVMPAAKQAVEFVKDNLKANFTIGVRAPKSLLTVHFKTNGVKDVAEYLLN